MFNTGIIVSLALNLGLKISKDIFFKLLREISDVDYFVIYGQNGAQILTKR